MVEYCPVRSVLDKHNIRDRPVVQKATHVVHRASIHIEKVAQAAGKAPGNVGRRDRMLPVAEIAIAKAFRVRRIGKARDDAILGGAFGVRGAAISLLCLDR